MVQWLRLYLANARRSGSISGPGTRIPHAILAWPKDFLKKAKEIAGNLAGNGKDGETVIPKGGLRDDDLDIFLHTIPGNDPNSPINFADQKKFMI